jgi:hypothetical protein
MEWIDEFIIKLETSINGIINVQIGGQSVVAQISPACIQFFKNNRQMLISVGREAFKNFLFLVSEKKNEEAFNVLLQGMSVDDIIARMGYNGEQLAQANKLKEDFIKSLKDFVIKSLTPIALKALWGLLI